MPLWHRLQNAGSISSGSPGLFFEPNKRQLWGLLRRRPVLKTFLLEMLSLLVPRPHNFKGKRHRNGIFLMNFLAVLILPPRRPGSANFSMERESKPISLQRAVNLADQQTRHPRTRLRYGQKP